MENSLYGIYDKKTKTYDKFFLEKNNISVIRGMQVSAKQDQKSMYFEFPEDYKVVQIAKYNPEKQDFYPENRDVMEFSEIVREKSED